MALSKPIINVVANYLQNLYVNPIRTKAITSCVLASIANFSSQLIAGEKCINYESIFAFGIFGLLFGGTIPHFFYKYLEKLFPARTLGLTPQIFIERIIYTPLFQMFALYATSRFEGKDHRRSLNTALNLIQKVVQTNWKYLTILHIFNFLFVPPMLRVLFVNLIGFCWVMYLAKVKRNEAKKADKK